MIKNLAQTKCVLLKTRMCRT